MNKTDEIIEEKPSATEITLREGIQMNKQTLANYKIDQAKKHALDAEDVENYLEDILNEELTCDCQE
jgi:hypothetical protein